MESKMVREEFEDGGFTAQKGSCNTKKCWRMEQRWLRSGQGVSTKLCVSVN